jgi:hypothetical protein
MVCSTYDDDENSGLSFGQVLKYGIFDAERVSVSEDDNEETDLKEDFDAVLDDVEVNCSDKLKTQRGKWSCVVCNAKAEKC